MRAAELVSPLDHNHIRLFIREIGVKAGNESRRQVGQAGAGDHDVEIRIRFEGEGLQYLPRHLTVLTCENKGSLKAGKRRFHHWGHLDDFGSGSCYKKYTVHGVRPFMPFGLIVLLITMNLYLQ